MCKIKIYKNDLKMICAGLLILKKSLKSADIIEVEATSFGELLRASKYRLNISFLSSIENAHVICNSSLTSINFFISVNDLECFKIFCKINHIRVIERLL